MSSESTHVTRPLPKEYIPRVILKLRRRSGAPLPISDDISTQLEVLGVRLNDLAQRFDLYPIPAKRFYRESQSQLDELRMAVKKRFGVLPDYENYIVLTCAAATSALALRSAHRLVTAILDSASHVVEHAYVEAPPAEPPSPNGVTAYGQQTYLQSAADGGIDAIGMWDIDAMTGAFNGSTGKGITIVDLEEGWVLPHGELTNLLPTIGVNRPLTAEHGTKVLGILGAQDIQSGCRGVAFDASLLPVSAWITNTNISRSSGIKAARDYLTANGLNRGSVLLLETQVGSGDNYVPVEVEDLSFLEIQNCVSAEITVIEAAADDQVDIDGILNSEDSGAVIVTGGVSTSKGWIAGGNQNHGKRIHCFAPAQQLVTIDPSDPTKTQTISETSAASAVVAGGAALLQSWAKSELGDYLDPQDLRFYLSNPLWNTQPVPGNDIGVMPNLTSIRDNLNSLQSSDFVARMIRSLRPLARLLGIRVPIIHPVVVRPRVVPPTPTGPPSPIGPINPPDPPPFARGERRSGPK